ncbi:nuclease [Methylobacterium radiodurans]|uniref:Nuclease n=2 Tax=Methylobacterium radiodurans TaxID=2202828 RepID=A0A2U8VPI6_9HYPH|nr:nuclease [Methylobacterium radiodurans]
MAASGPTAADGADGTEARRPVLDGAERAGLQAQIRTEIERRRPRPVALRTLELLVSAAVEPLGEQPGYRVIDRHGLPRTREAAGVARPLTLADLLDELAARHPALFLPPEPEPAPAEPVPETGLSANAAEMRAATARFVETQSERARALAERSSEQGRALAQSAAAAFSGLRARLDSRRGVEGTSGDGIAAGAPAWREGAQDRLRRLRDGLDDWRHGGLGGLSSRRVAGVAAAVLALCVGAGLVLSWRGSGEDAAVPQQQAAADGQPPQPQTQSQAAAPAEAPPAETESQPEEAPRPPPNAVTGQAQVIDTATLRLNGKLVRLFGVEWVRGGQAEELTRYINNRPVTCQPVPGSENQLCQIEGRDLSEVVLFNGGGRASPEATPELVAAEDHARSERLGVWKR